MPAPVGDRPAGHVARADRPARSPRPGGPPGPAGRRVVGEVGVHLDEGVVARARGPRRTRPGRRCPARTWPSGAGRGCRPARRPAFSARSAVPSGLPSSTTRIPASGSGSRTRRRTRRCSPPRCRWGRRPGRARRAAYGTAARRRRPAPPTTSGVRLGSAARGLARISRTTHLDGPAHRDAEQRTHEGPRGPQPTRSPMVAPTRTAIRTQQRVEAHRLAHDDRVQDVVLDLLVDEEDDGEHDEGRRASGRAAKMPSGPRPAAPRPGAGGRPGPPTEPDRSGEGHPQDHQGDEDHHPGDDRGDEVPEHVAGDRPGRPRRRPGTTRAAPLGLHHAEEARRELRRLQQEKNDEHGDGRSGRPAWRRPRPPPRGPGPACRFLVTSSASLGAFLCTQLLDVEPLEQVAERPLAVLGLAARASGSCWARWVDGR